MVKFKFSLLILLVSSIVYSQKAEIRNPQ